MKDNPDLVETAYLAGNFRIFLQALESAALRETLRLTGPYTIFAPVDEAFTKIAIAKLRDVFRRENRESLRSLLKNHIVAGTLLTTDLEHHHELRSMGGEDLKIVVRTGVWISDARIIAPDLKAFNGVIHGIDTVLMPQTSVAPHRLVRSGAIDQAITAIYSRSKNQ